MRTACLLLLTIGWAVLMNSMAHAVDSSPEFRPATPDGVATTLSNHPGAASQGSTADNAKDQKNGKALDEQRDPHDVLGKNLERSHANLTKTKYPTPVPSSRARSRSATAINFRQPGPSRSGGAERKGLVRNETVNSTVLVRSPSIVRRTPTTLGSVRHRSPNPAIITGLVNSKTGNAGAINGTRMDRRR